MNTGEQRFMAMVDAVDIGGQDVSSMLAAMAHWRTSLEAAMETSRLCHDGLLPQSELAGQAALLNAEVERGKHAWAAQWVALQQARCLAEQFDDKVMLLVFGKFNSGKSSLCNFLAGRFAAHGYPVQYFHLAEGTVVAVDEAFQEGATETTARLQGVCLGDSLVLLDTPGLHSATDENAALAQRFLESADAVVWLTSSTSPGQVQELDELAHELRRAKPLLPVVTRSDVLEEDEVDGALVKCLRNKTAANRTLQEDDVLVRGREKLGAMAVAPSLLKPPVSVSAHVARTQGQSDDALAEAGFERLYAALSEIVGPALAYKQRKPAEILLHYLEEKVLGYLCTTTLPALAALKQAVTAQRQTLPQRHELIVQGAWRDVVPDLPQLLDLHAPQRDVEAVCAQVGAMVAAAFARHADVHLPGHALVPLAPVPMNLPAGAAYDAPPLGGVGDDEEWAAVGYERLYAALDHAVRSSLDALSTIATQDGERSLQQMETRITEQQDVIARYQQRLDELKSALQPAGKNRVGQIGQVARFGT